RAAQSPGRQFRHRRVARRGGGVLDPLRPAGQGARRVAAVAGRRHPGGAAVNDRASEPAGAVTPFDTPERRALRELTALFVRREAVPYLADWEAGGEVPRDL